MPRLTPFFTLLLPGRLIGRIFLFSQLSTGSCSEQDIYKKQFEPGESTCTLPPCAHPSLLRIRCDRRYSKEAKRKQMSTYEGVEWSAKVKTKASDACDDLVITAAPDSTQRNQQAYADTLLLIPNQWSQKYHTIASIRWVKDTSSWRQGDLLELRKEA